MKRLWLILFIIALTVVPVVAQQTEDEEEIELPECPILEGEPTNVRVSYYMGEALGRLGASLLSQAEDSLSCIILVIDPDYLPAYMTRAQIYTRTRDYEAAIEDYTDAIDLDPSLVAAYNNRGIAYFALREYDLAAADFDQAIERDADFVAGYNNRAIVHTILGEYEAAIDLLNSVIAQTGIEDVYEELTDPERPSGAEAPEYERVDARAYALLGIVRSRQALDQYNKYAFLSGGATDGRISSAAGALESRFTFELRLDDGSWLLTEVYTPLAPEDDDSVE